MAAIGTIRKPLVEMHKSTPQWQSFLQMIVTLIAIITCIMQVSGKFAKMETNQSNDRDQYQRDKIQLDYRMNKMDDKLDKQTGKIEDIRILMEQKQNRP